MARGRRRRGHHGVLCLPADVELVAPDFVGLGARAGGAVLAYIFGLRQGKPPGYDRDILSTSPRAAALHQRFSPPAAFATRYQRNVNECQRTQRH